MALQYVLAAGHLRGPCGAQLLRQWDGFFVCSFIFIMFGVFFCVCVFPVGINGDGDNVCGDVYLNDQTEKAFLPRY